VNMVTRLPAFSRGPLPSPPPLLPLSDNVGGDDVRMDGGDADLTINAQAPRFTVALVVLSSQLLIKAASFKLPRRESTRRVLTTATRSLDRRWWQSVEQKYRLHQYLHLQRDSSSLYYFWLAMQGDIFLGALLQLTDLRFIKRCYEMKSNVLTKSQCTYVYSHLREFEILRHLDGTVT
jgi:hypothetical protein